MDPATKRMKTMEPTTLIKPKEDFTSSSNFADVLNTKLFVDKSMIIKATMENAANLIITAPRKSGKSTNLNMLQRFLEIEVDEDGKKKTKQNDDNYPVNDTDNYKLFVSHNLKITNETDIMNEHFGKYPVLLINFNLKSEHKNFEDFLISFYNFLRALFQKRNYLLNSDNLSCEERTKFSCYVSQRDLIHTNFSMLDLESGILFLSKILNKHFSKKVIILIDNFHFVASHTYYNDRINKFICNVISKLAKSTGICQIVLVGFIRMFSTVGLNTNDFEQHPFLESTRFSEFFQLTSNEVVDLLAKSPFMFFDKDDLSCWYGGYRILGTNTEMHNMWSVLNALHNKTTKCYFISDIDKSLQNALKIDRILNEFQKLFFGGQCFTVNYTVKANIEHIRALKYFLLFPKSTDVTTNFFIEFLYENSFLKVLKKTDDEITFQIPNIEIMKFFTFILIDNEYSKWFTSLQLGATRDTLHKCAQYLHNLFYGITNEYDLKRKLFSFYTKSFNCNDCLPVDIICSNAVEHNREFQIIVRKNNFEIIADVTDTKSAEECLQNILNKKYGDYDSNYRLLIGIHYSVQKTTLGYVWNSNDINKAVYVTSENSIF